MAKVGVRGVARAWELEPDGQSYSFSMGSVTLGKPLNLSGLRLLICKTGMLPASPPAHLFNQHPLTPAIC